MPVRDPLVVIVAYRNNTGLVESLSLVGGNLPVLVVDNDSSPAVQEIVSTHGGRYTAPPRNIGFAAAVNVALRERGDRHVLLLNPDARLDAESARRLCEKLGDQPKLGAVAPRLLDDDGRPQKVRWPVPSPREEWVDALKLRGLFAPKREFVIGAVLLLRAEAIDEVGGFDEQFFLYAEECDWQLRAMRMGWQVAVDESVVARHSGGGSSPDDALRQVYAIRSAELFGRKWYGRYGWGIMRVGSIVAAVLRLPFAFLDPAARSRYLRQIRA